MAKRFPSGHAVIKTRLPRLTSRFQAPNPLRPGNYESLKLSSPRGIRNRVPPIILNERKELGTYHVPNSVGRITLALRPAWGKSLGLSVTMKCALPRIQRKDRMHRRRGPGRF